MHRFGTDWVGINAEHGRKLLLSIWFNNPAGLAFALQQVNGFRCVQDFIDGVGVG